jgi:hypothetical protein
VQENVELVRRTGDNFNPFIRGELIEAPDDRVVVSIRQSGRGRESGVPIVIHFFEVLTLRDGNVRKIEYFRHRADALEAAGLRE